MPLNLPANRMELFKRKRMRAQATKGLKLLKDKLEAVMAEFLVIARRYKEEKGRFTGELLQAQARFACQSASMPFLEYGGLTKTSKFTIKRSEKRLMTLVLPKLELDVFEPDTALPPQTATAGAMRALTSYKKLVRGMIRVAELETSMRELALEIQKTRRRVNALEHVMVPQLESEVKTIQSKLDEAERANLSRLQRVKDILEQKEVINKDK
jgi:V/A-type H+/Na+-transporting ATPase subunit D